MRRLLAWLRKTWRGVPTEVTGEKRTGLPWDHPDSDPLGDVHEAIRADRARQRRSMGTEEHLSDYDLLPQGQKELFDELAPPDPSKTVAYPPPAEMPVQDWVTSELMKRTGGITRHPYDLTKYPTPPTEQDLAARDYVNAGLGSIPAPRAYFTHGYSMRYLSQLKRRAELHDTTLSTEDLMALRARGLA